MNRIIGEAWQYWKIWNEWRYGSTQPTGYRYISYNRPMLLTLFQFGLSLVSLLILARFFGFLAEKAKLPAVLAEILLGVWIGPTFLGSLNPEASNWLFPTTGNTSQYFTVLAKLACLLLLFVAGLEMNLKALRSDASRVLRIAAGSFLLPLVVGATTVLLFPTLFGVYPDQPWLVPVFIGIALSISALPVIIRILMDFGLYRTPVGMLTVTSASIMDLMGWFAYTALQLSLAPISLHTGYLEQFLGVVLSHTALLSLVAGVVVGTVLHLPAAGLTKFQNFVLRFLSPVFFVSIGIGVNFATYFSLPLVLLILALAVVSKIVGTYAGGKASGLSNKDALAIGIALNARGAMEIILSKDAHEAGLIQTQLFVALVVMALITSLISSLGIKALMERRKAS